MKNKIIWWIVFIGINYSGGKFTSSILKSICEPFYLEKILIWGIGLTASFSMAFWLAGLIWFISVMLDPQDAPVK